MSVRLLVGDCRERLTELRGNSVDTIITDPPYGLTDPRSFHSPKGSRRGFMGKAWDAAVPGPEYWQACWRVAKPGAYALVFGGTRTWHRLACALEDAGWVLVDTLMWLHSQGFPKSFDISKAFDRKAGAKRPVVGRYQPPGMPTPWNLRRATDRRTVTLSASSRNNLDVTAPVTTLAQAWDGWGTSLKPAWESILVARKPLEVGGEHGTILASLNCLEARLCLLLSDAARARVLSGSSPSEEALLATARWDADARTSSRAALSARTGTSRFELAVRSCLSIVSAWSNTLAAVWLGGNTSTTVTGVSPTTDWRTLKSCLSVLTLDTIIRAELRQPGSGFAALPVAVYFSAAVANIGSTHALSALDPVISSVLEKCPVETDLGLKPEWRPILVAMKPLVGDYTRNARQFGVAGFHINGARIPTAEALTNHSRSPEAAVSKGRFGGSRAQGTHQTRGQRLGRWPANVVHDGSPDVLAHFPEAPGQMAPSIEDGAPQGNKVFGAMRRGGSHHEPRPDQGGSASRFFYVAKATTRERGADNDHTTVKPLALMEWLCRLTKTPTGGVVLDPFCGSGSTLIAARLTGRPAIGIEIDPHYITLAERRLRGQGLWRSVSEGLKVRTARRAKAGGSGLRIRGG